MMRSFGFITFSLLTFVVNSQVAVNDSDPFALYAYGEGLGGLPVFATGIHIYAGNFSLVNDNETAPVIFNIKDDIWSVSPNTTSGQKPGWSNFTFAVPGPSSTSHDVTLLKGNETGDFVTSFDRYGSFVMVYEDGEPLSHWYAVHSDVDGVYSLGWNASDIDTSEDKIVITLRSMPPSHPSVEE